MTGNFLETLHKIMEGLLKLTGVIYLVNLIKTKERNKNTSKQLKDTERYYETIKDIKSLSDDELDSELFNKS